MEFGELAELHYLVHVKNIPSILAKGVLCRRLALPLAPKEIAAAEILERRDRRFLPDGSKAEDYANLYINGRNPMLFRILFKEEIAGKHLQTAILRIRPEILNHAGVILTDGNWASGYTAPLPSPDGLSKLDRAFMFAKYWAPIEADEQERSEAIRMRCAEVLVPGKVPTDYILGAHVATPQVEADLQRTCGAMPMTVTPYNFFPTRWIA